MRQVDLMVRSGDGGIGSVFVFDAALLSDSDDCGVKYFWSASKKGSQPYEVREQNCDKLFDNLHEALECVECVCSPYCTDYLQVKTPEDWAMSEVPAYRKWAAAQQGLSQEVLLRLEADPCFGVRHEAQKALGFCSMQNPYRAPRNHQSGSIEQNQPGKTQMAYINLTPHNVEVYTELAFQGLAQVNPTTWIADSVYTEQAVAVFVSAGSARISTKITELPHGPGDIPMVTTEFGRTTGMPEDVSLDDILIVSAAMLSMATAAGHPLAGQMVSPYKVVRSRANGSQVLGCMGFTKR